MSLIIPEILLPYLNLTDAVMHLDLANWNEARLDNLRPELLATHHQSFFLQWHEAYLKEIGSHHGSSGFDSLMRAQSYYIMADQNRYVGFLELRMQTPVLALLAGIWTPPEERGRGWSSRMVHACLHMLKCRNLHDAFMMTGNPIAQAVYKKAGARVIRE